MKNEFYRYLKVMIGLFFLALGAIATLNSNLGLPPWDVLNQGLGIVMDISIGNASIIIGVLIVIIDIVLGQPVGIGTIFNFIFIGLFMNIIQDANFLPFPTTFTNKLIELLLGVIFYSFGTYLYMIQGMGCGPRDGLMQILTQRLKKPVSLVKNTIECIALILGWYLGGTVGIGTIIIVITTGIMLEGLFRYGPVNIHELKHRNLKEEWEHLKDIFSKKN